jgi:CRISPR-associated protein Csd2
MSLQNKIDFALIFTVNNANPNGDPLNGNRPRTNFDGFGEVSDVCLKRKIRNRLMDEGECIFVQSDENRTDDYRSLKARADGNSAMKAAKERPDKVKIACETWLDVRAFGQVFAFGKSDAEGSVSIGVRGPVCIQSAYSLEPVDITSMQITKSVNLETGKDPDKKGSDTMGMKHRVDNGVYVAYGSMNCQLAERTGFSEEDAEKIKRALLTLFMNDTSAARPDGSMAVKHLVWWRHNSKNGQYSAAKVHDSLRDIIGKDGKFDESKLKEALPGLVPEVYEGE